MRKIAVTRYAQAVATDLFIDMLNPKSKGENFTWEKFPNMAARIAESHLFMNVLDPTEKEKKLAFEEAENGLRELLKGRALFSSRVKGKRIFFSYPFLMRLNNVQSHSK